MTIKEQSLKEALEYSRCRELPKQGRDDDSRFWTYAIILVKKRNLTESYTIAKRRGDGSFSYICDFGTMSPIYAVISIHPYLYLDDTDYGLNCSLPRKRANLRAYYPDMAEKIDAADEDTIQILTREMLIGKQHEVLSTHSILDEIEQRVINETNNIDMSNKDIPAANRARKQARKS